MSQFIGHFSVSRFERVKGERPVEPSTGGLCKLGQILLALVQHTQSQTQAVDIGLIKLDRRLSSTQQRVELGAFGCTRDLSVRNHVNRNLRPDKSL